MSDWIVKRTDTFLKYLKKQKHNNELLNELDKKINRLIEDPPSVGGNLSRNLHGHKSIRLVKNFRLIFIIDDKNKIIYLEALDHRKDIY